jgi:hypothetical protein
MTTWRPGGDRVEVGENRSEPLLQRLPRQKIDFLVGKIDGGLDVGAQSRDPRFQIGDARGELALHRAHRRASCGGGAGVDQVGNRFGLRDVDFAVQEGALRELAGPRQAAAEFEQALQQQIDDERAAVALDFQHVFAGVRRRRGKVQGEALIHAVAVRVQKTREPRLAWSRKRAENAGRDLRHLGT